MKVFLATHNKGKIERFKNLLDNPGVYLQLYTPVDFGLENVEVEETGTSLAENAELKAKAYFGKVDMPILSNDTGFYVEGEGFVVAPKRTALEGVDENSMTDQERADIMTQFWKGVARKHGGKVDAAWVEAFVLLKPDGELVTSESRREVILTDQTFGEAHVHMPVRALYISKATNKPAIQHTRDEEILELRPITEALLQLLRS